MSEEQNIERIEEDGVASLDSIIKQVNDVFVPADLLPSTIPPLQRLRDAPYLFSVLIVSLDLEDEMRYFFLTDWESLIDLERRHLYYETRKGRVYRIQISKNVLPKSLNIYTKALRVFISYIKCNNEIRVDAERATMYIKVGSFDEVKKYHPLSLVVSILFYIIPRLPFDLPL